MATLYAYHNYAGLLKLQEMEVIQLLTHAVPDSRPVFVEYAITPHGRNFESVLEALSE